MLQFPNALHQLHFFEANGLLYAADMEKARVVEIDALMHSILTLAPTQTMASILHTLGTVYAEDAILAAFETLAEYATEGLLFTRGETLAATFSTDNNRRKLLVAIPGIAVDSFFDIERLYAGTNMALSYMIRHLTEYAELHFTGAQNRQIVEGVYEVDIGVDDVARLRSKIGETYFGILTLHREHEEWLLPLYRYLELPPILVQCHAPRGHGGRAINSILRHYAAMRDCDAFTAPSDYVREFYAHYVWDPSFFNTLPNGVDAALFQPLDKAQAKREVSEHVGDARVQTMPTVGYLSRVQSEKGASVYLKLAKLNPHLLFLIAGPNLGRYASQELPENLLYAGFHPREKLPLLYNAFDVYCFLSMSGEETFGLTVLEAMACGVPPIVPDFDGVPSVVGDAGLIAAAETFDQDIGTLVSYPAPLDFSAQIHRLLNDDALRHTLSQKARERAVSFTWDKTACRIMHLFEELHRKKRLISPNKLLHVFAPTPAATAPKGAGTEGTATRGHPRLTYKSLVLNMNTHYEQCLMGNATYSQRVEEGLVLSLLKNHTAREAEALLAAIVADETEARALLRRVLALIHATA